jgi:predicted RND superfamily exporter protein
VNDGSEITRSGETEGRRHRLALGIERIGLIALRFPLAIAVILIALSVAAGFGIERIKVDDSLSTLFRSDTPDFHTYEYVTHRFPSEEFDELIGVTGPTLLERGTLSKMRDAVIDLQLIDGVRGLISLFSARQPPEPGKLPKALFPEILPKAAAYQELVKRVRSNEIIRGKLLSNDGKLALIVLALKPEVVGSNALGRVIGEIRQTLREDLAGSGVHAELTGVPVIQHELRNAVERDRMIYNTFGLLAGCLIAIMFFRRVSYMVVAAGPPLIAILLALGTLGWFGFELNMFLNVMTPLIMVISFSDSMQLTFAARAAILRGDSKRDAFRQAILVVGPACVLTHATAALSFIALQFSQSDLIRTFGQAGLLATVIALFAVLIMAPTLGLLLVREEADIQVKASTVDRSVDWLRRFCAWIAGKMVHRPLFYTVISVLVVSGLGFIYAQLPARYRLADQLPDREQAVQAGNLIDAKLHGANPIDVLIQFPKGASLYAPQTLAVIDDVQSAVEKQKGMGNVWSLATLQRWLAEKAGRSDVATLKEYVSILPKQIINRFIAPQHDAAIVQGRVEDLDASKLLPDINALDRSLNAVRARHPDFKISVTGLSAVAARNSAAMIGRLNRGLTVEIVFVAAFIGLAFRSFIVMLASIMPAIFPIFVAGSILWLQGKGLQFASIVALIVSFGLGLSATIHFLNRMREEDDPEDDPGAAVERATVLMGPPLILTSVVLACGLAVTVLSDLPSLRLFGWLSAVAMLAALVADLTILRPTITLLRIIARRLRRGVPLKPSPSAHESAAES